MEATPNMAPGAHQPFDVHRILVPTDFSECAGQALAYALALAAEHQAAIRLLHVMTLHKPVLYEREEASPHASALRRDLEAQAQDQLAAAAGLGAEHNVRVEPILRRNPAPTPAILDEAVASDADLIVLGTHGRRGLGHLLLGSVAEEVVRRAPVSVLTVRDDAPVEPSRIRRILAPTDFSEYAALAVQVAKDLARRYGASLDLLHVVEPIPFPASITLGRKNIYDYVPELRHHVQDTLKQLAADGTVSSSVHVEHGHAASTITGFAEARQTDLIVLATHGLTGLARFFIGSVTERVVRTAACPVLSVRALAPPGASDLAASDRSVRGADEGEGNP